MNLFLSDVTLLFDFLLQRSTVAKLVDQVDVVVRPEKLDQFDDVRVWNLLKNIDFIGGELVQLGHLVKLVDGDLLDGKNFLWNEVLALKHLTIAPFSQLISEQIVLHLLSHLSIIDLTEKSKFELSKI